MKKLATLAMSLVLLIGLFMIPASAANAIPAATDWFAVQGTGAPTHSVVTAKGGRITVESIVNGGEPGAGMVWYTVPIDFESFEVTLSLDSYTKCKDQFLGIHFVNGGADLSAEAGNIADPYFFHLLRPTDLATVISCGEGLVCNYDTDRKMIRVGKSNYAAGAYFEGEVDASWTNVVYKVCRNDANDGYDVYINGKRINNDNKWAFVDEIEEKTGSSEWYFGINFKDGNYAPAKFTIKTINGQPAVDTSVNGIIQNSILKDGESYVAVGGKMGDKVAGNSSTTTTKKPDTVTTTKKEEGTTTTDGGSANDATTTDGGSEDATTTEGGDTQTTDGGSDTTTTTKADEQTDTDPDGGSLMWLLWVGIAVVVIAAGVCVYLFVIRPKNKN